MWGLNPRPSAHKTNALPSELIERITIFHFDLNYFNDILILSNFHNFTFNLYPNWRMWASIPLPLACKASALPFELIPLKRLHVEFNQPH